MNVALSLVYVSKLSYSLSEKYTLSYVEIHKSNLSGLIFQKSNLTINQNKKKMYFRLSSAVGKCSSANACGATFCYDDSPLLTVGENKQLNKVGINYEHAAEH